MNTPVNADKGPLYKKEINDINSTSHFYTNKEDKELKLIISYIYKKDFK